MLVTKAKPQDSQLDMNSNRIAVLIPVHNAERYIGRAISSLNDNTEGHDVIIVDDGSRVPVGEFLSSQANLHVIRLETNQGIARALNVGLSHISSTDYEYVARLDADDRAMPNRLAVQSAYLDLHKDVLLVGSWARVALEDGTPVSYNNMPTGPANIRECLYYNNCLFHPSWMFRASVIRSGLRYDESRRHAEDYEFLRAISHLGAIENIPEYLIDYSISAGGVSQSHAFEQRLGCLSVQLAHANLRNINFYLGIAKTLAIGLPESWFKSTFLRHTAVRKDLSDATRPNAEGRIPVYEWRPLRGLILTKTP
ncbi:MAG: glycosyltransferase [Alphaproteobacteria bacterium]